MRIESTYKCAIAKEGLSSFVNSIELLNHNIIMKEKLIYRTVFQDSNNNKKWVRVKIGDIDEHNNDFISITIKQNVDIEGKKHAGVIELKVDDYYEANELLNKIGWELKSKQETRRTKYFCSDQNGQYIINIDEWPWLEEYRFIRIHSIEGENTSIGELISNLDITPLKSIVSGELDDFFRNETGSTLTELEEVSFSLPPPKKITNNN